MSAADFVFHAALVLLMLVLSVVIPVWYLVLAPREPTWAIRWRVVSVGNSAWNQGERGEESRCVTRRGARRAARRLNSGETGSAIWRAEIERRT